jgi:hypothetical protein
MVIETRTFRLAAGVDEASFREADARLQVEFAYRQRGLLRRTAAMGEDGEWLVVNLWRSPEDREAARSAEGDDEAAQAFAVCIVDETRRAYALLD